MKKIEESNNSQYFMHNITLVCTFHSELGKCNADALYKIIEQINPDVIFEEITPYLSDMVYNKGFYDETAPLELKCIREYKLKHNIKNIPVDIEVNSTLSNEVDRMFALIGNYDIYNQIVIEQKKNIEQCGFDFLNSEEFSDLVKKQRSVEREIVGEINKRQLDRIYKSFYNDMDFREIIMLNTIYAYSEEINYNQAVFLIGAGHRSSIISKIIEYQLKEEIKLNWKF